MATIRREACFRQRAITEIFKGKQVAETARKYESAEQACRGRGITEQTIIAGEKNTEE